jgi:SLT domain-containing protein
MAIAESVAQQWSPTKALNFIHAESTFKHNAKAGTSSAQGLMQLTDSAFKDAEKLAGRKLNRNSPRDNVTAGVIYAKSLEDRLEAATGKRPPEYLVYTAYHSGFGGAMKLLDPKNQTKPAAALLPDHAKANRAMYFNPNGRPYSIKKVRQNLKDYYEAKRLDK